VKKVFVLWLKNEDLKPCPFCGGKARLGLIGAGEFRVYGVMCRSCGAGGRTRVQKRRAVNHWNKRADAVDALERADADLLAALEGLRNRGVLTAKQAEEAKRRIAAGGAA